MWPTQDDTIELLGNARRGDAGAVNQLLDRHRDSLHRMVACRLNQAVGRRVDASDVVQDTLLTASKRLAEYLASPSMPFHAWLRQLARDRLADVYRRELAAKRHVGREQNATAVDHSSLNLLAQAADDQLTPAAMMLKKEFAERFRVAVEQLEDDARDLILMRHAEQLTNSQVAELLGLSEPAAGMRYLRALRQLRAILGDASGG